MRRFRALSLLSGLALLMVTSGCGFERVIVETQQAAQQAAKRDVFQNQLRALGRTYRWMMGTK